MCVSAHSLTDKLLSRSCLTGGGNGWVQRAFNDAETQDEVKHSVSSFEPTLNCVLANLQKSNMTLKSRGWHFFRAIPLTQLPEHIGRGEMATATTHTRTHSASRPNFSTSLRKYHGATCCLVCLLVIVVTFGQSGGPSGSISLTRGLGTISVRPAQDP